MPSELRCRDEAATATRHSESLTESGRPFTLANTCTLHGLSTLSLPTPAETGRSARIGQCWDGAPGLAERRRARNTDLAWRCMMLGGLCRLLDNSPGSATVTCLRAWCSTTRRGGQCSCTGPGAPSLSPPSTPSGHSLPGLLCS